MNPAGSVIRFFEFGLLDICSALLWDDVDRPLKWLRQKPFVWYHISSPDE